MLGYPEAAFADADHALKDACEINQAATLMYPDSHAVDFYPMRKLRESKRVNRPSCRTGGRKGRLVLEGARNDGSRLCISLDRQSL